MISGKIEGTARVLSQLLSVDEKVGKKALRKVASSASSRCAKAAKSLVPKRRPRSIPRAWAYRGDQLKRSIGRKVRQYAGTAVGIVGARTGFRIVVGTYTRDGSRHKAGEPVFVDPVKYLHLVILGAGGRRGDNFLAKARDREAAAVAADAARIVGDAIGGAL